MPTPGTPARYTCPSDSLHESLNRLAAHLRTTTALTLADAAAAAEPEEKRVPVDLAVTTDVLTDYVWRGQHLTDDPVVQPSAALACQGLSLNVWGSFDATDIHEEDGEEWRLQEVD